MIHLQIYILLLIICVSVTWASDIISTTPDGDFQAIAQSPNSIAIYWRHNGQPVTLFKNGKQIGTYEPNTTSAFSSCIVTSLEPNAYYAYNIESKDQMIIEKTWCKLTDDNSYDILIIGGTSSGVATAITAARLGLRVALVEETNRLGGMVSNGLSSTDIRNVSRSNGIFEDFRQKVIDYYGTSNGLRYEPRVANAIFKSMVYEFNNISLFLKHKAISPIFEGNRVRGAFVKDLTSDKSGQFLARITIDATDTADFAASSGAQSLIGRESRTEEEPHAGFIYFNDETQEILPGSTGACDNRQQSYAYLMTWKDYGETDAPLIDKPANYDPENYRNSPDWNKTWNYTSGKLPNSKFEINQHPFGIDWPGINYDYPTADKTRRQEIAELYKNRVLGYLYFMQNERGHKNLGLADDEFIDNCNFPNTLYVREARRILGEYLFKENDVICARDICRVDSIAIGDYPMDSHATEDLKDPSASHKGEGEMWLADFTPWYQVPYGVIIPRNVNGLLVSTAVSATHVGYGTLRMEPVRMSLGQAAAVTAYWSILYGKEPRDINPAWVQDKLLSQYAYINWNSDVNRNTRHFKAINFLGARGVFKEEAFKPEDPLTQQSALDALNRLIELENCSPNQICLSIPSSDKPVTRGQFALLLVEAKQKTSDEWCWVTPRHPSYSDIPTDSPYYAAVETLRAHRIDPRLFEDSEPGLFKPNAIINRADAAEAIYLSHRAFAMNNWLP